MRAPPIAVFAAGFLAGALALGAVAAHANLVMLNSQVAGVLPGAMARLICVTANSEIRPVVGQVLPSGQIPAAGGGYGQGVNLRCPN
jgi:hypothetical protein